MTIFYIKNIPDDIANAVDSWGKAQIPALNRTQAVISILKEWYEQQEQNQQTPTYPESEERLIS